MEFIVKKCNKPKVTINVNNDDKESESNFRQIELGFSVWGVLFVFQRKQRRSYYVNRAVQKIAVFAAALRVMMRLRNKKVCSFRLGYVPKLECAVLPIYSCHFPCRRPLMKTHHLPTTFPAKPTPYDIMYMD